MQAPSRPLWHQYAAPVLLLGPAYGGKSELAMQALRPDLAATVIGTAPPDEPVFTTRLAQLQSLRPAGWRTLHAGPQVVKTLAEAAQYAPEGQFLIDAVNQWLAVLLLAGSATPGSEAQRYQALETQITELIRLLGAYPLARFVLVSAEVGAGPAPARTPERLYRQAVGITNQRLAQVARTVVSVQAGLGQVIKGDSR